MLFFPSLPFSHFFVSPSSAVIFFWLSKLMTHFLLPKEMRKRDEDLARELEALKHKLEVLEQQTKEQGLRSILSIGKSQPTAQNKQPI